MVSVSEANKQLGKSPFSVFSFILVCLYVLGELVALRAAKLSNKRNLRKLDTRKNQIQKEVEQKAKQNEDKKKAGVAVDDVQINTKEGSKAPPGGKTSIFGRMTSVSKAMAVVKSKVVKTKDSAKKMAKNPMAELTKKGKSLRNRSKSPKKGAKKAADKVETVTEKAANKVAKITEKKPKPETAERPKAKTEAVEKPKSKPKPEAVENVADVESPKTTKEPAVAKTESKVKVSASKTSHTSQNTIASTTSTKKAKKSKKAKVKKMEIIEEGSSKKAKTKKSDKIEGGSSKTAKAKKSDKIEEGGSKKAKKSKKSKKSNK